MSAVDTVTAYHKRLWEEKELDAIETYMDDQVVLRTALNGDIPKDELYGTLSTWLEAFPDLVIEWEKPVIEGDQVVFRWMASGTHQGEFNHIPATGAAVQYQGVSWYKVADDKIVEYWSLIDLPSLMVQLLRQVEGMSFDEEEDA